MADEDLMREYIQTVKQERRRRTTQRVGKILGMFGKVMPRGIRHPDSLVRNLHLYHPGYRGKTRLY